jgi:ribonucleoside-triphosphate reductase
MTAIIKRNGSVEPFNEEKIRTAVMKCLTGGVGLTGTASGDISEEITQRVVNILRPKDAATSVEDIQNLVEQQLMAAGYYEAARKYILFRETRRQRRSYLPIDPEEARLLAEDKLVLKNPGQLFQHYSKYARWDEEKGRRESWREAVGRVIGFLRNQFGEALDEDEWAYLAYNIYTTRAMPSMRLMQMAGPAAERCNVCVFNCSYLPIDSIQSFAELLYILMQGTGAGYSVELEYVDKLPRIKKQKSKLECHRYIIEDSTEGWCEAFKFGLTSWFNGEDVLFDYSLIREQGARLNTKGGRASGPEPLRALLDFSRDRILAKQGQRLASIDVHDICCMAGQIVQVGGVRRAAEISLSDLDDLEMRDAKKGQFWNYAPQRSMANNSAVYHEKPPSLDFLREWMALAESGTGERGIFNRAGIMRQKPKRRKLAQFGTNPCGEIALRPKSFCNLSIAVARPDDTEESLIQKVTQAAIFGTLQSCLTNFSYLSEDWKRNCEEERLLGVDITGQMDCPLLQPGAAGRKLLLEKLRDTAVRTNEEYAARLGINASVAVTCKKPGGNSGQLLDCSAWVRYADYFIRRFRSGAYDPITRMLQDAGVPWYPEVGQSRDTCSVVVFEFPMKSPESAITRNDLTAIEQLNDWLDWKKHFTEHNPSITIYVDDYEWLDVAHWVYKNWEWVGGISFLPKDGGVYQLAPYQDISKEEYEKRMRDFPDIDWTKLRYYETSDETTSSQEYACVGNSCEL